MTEHADDDMTMPGVRDEFEKVYVESLARFTRDYAAGVRPNNWLEYCMLPWRYHTFPFCLGRRSVATR